MAYNMKVDLIPDLPHEGYRKGVGAWEGVCIHETACKDDSDESEISYFKKYWRERRAFVHAFIDEDSTTQAAKWEYKTWAQGRGNDRFISLEMCYSGSQKDFDIIYSKTCWLAATKLFERKLGVVDGVSLVSHDFVRRTLGGTTHTDPIAYLKKWNKTWADMVRDTKAVYATLSKPVTKPVAKPIPEKPYGCNIYIEEKLIASGFIDNGKSFVPIRLVGEALGHRVNYDRPTSQATIDGLHITSTVNEGGTTYGWSAEIAKVTGSKLEWDAKTRSVHFSKE